MLVKTTKCPHCGGNFALGSDKCIYCGSGLIYEGTKEEIEEQLKESQKIRFEFKQGRLQSLAYERSYWGCPKCFKKRHRGNLICEHIEEPIELFWRKYVVRDLDHEKFVVECNPRVEKLEEGKHYHFTGIFYPEEDRFIAGEVRELE